MSPPEARRKISRQERNEEVRRSLFRAAGEIVGERGYEEASISRITERAGVANGTFYNHFETRQELLDQLLPSLGEEMIEFIRQRTRDVRPERDRELARFRAFFEFLVENPGFLRILNEAEFSAPEAYRQHIQNVSLPYLRILQRARGAGETRDFTDAELEAVVHILIGARGYLSQRYAYAEGGARLPDEAVFDAYAKLLIGGLFAESDKPGAV
ncbi:TetR/AcrR family transcriptional regulator [Phenylobacterium sp.]|jgi:AcrR family transcriptional regulator|uniref:TetR/AcrR family transcriptional regulator n=1 Tax=Phenylobacterium sp. TaxID=1871053 RepID=UPI002F947F84